MRHYFTMGARASQWDFDMVDLDLLGLKLIEATNRPGGHQNRISLTERGVLVLHQHRQADIAARSVHHSLGSRLAEFLRAQGRITWENVEFRNLVAEKDIDYQRVRLVRPDVFSIAPSLQLKYANPCVHEVKVNRADFISDLSKPEKREAYSAMAEAVYYVTPAGLIDPKEIPQGFGLLVEKEPGQFALVKRPRKRKVALQPHHYLNMIVKPGAYPAGYRE